MVAALRLAEDLSLGPFMMSSGSKTEHKGAKEIELGLDMAMVVLFDRLDFGRG
jgi:hypothetical protein